MIDSILTLTKEFIKIPSISGDVQKSKSILELAKKQLLDYTFVPFVSANTSSLLYSNREADLKKFKIILNAHLDVIPASEDQFHPRIEDDKLYGRGTYDMKAAAAVMILLFNKLGRGLPYPLGLQLTTDEEIGGVNGTKHQIGKGVRADFTITGECTSLRIIHEAKGNIIAKLTANGHSAHSAYPWHGKNAIWIMYETLGNLLAKYPVPEKESEKTTINIAKIETENDAYNKIPDKCIAYLDIRFSPIEKEAIVSTLKSLLGQNITLEIIHNFIPHSSDRNNYYINQLRESGKKVLGTKLSVDMANGASDARYFSEVKCEAIEFGPLGHGQHGRDEWVDLKSLETYYQILENFLVSIK